MTTSAANWQRAPGRRAAHVLAPAVLVLLGGLTRPASADDTEIFFQVPANVVLSRPNVLFILDTSASMAETIGFSKYSHDTTYNGKCEVNRIYWTPGSEQPTDAQIADCSLPYVGQNWVNQAAADDWFKCGAAEEDMIEYGRTLVQGVAQWDGTKWAAINPRDPKSDRYTECASDAGQHGSGTDAARTYAIANNKIKPADPGPWTSAAGSKLNYTGQLNNPYTFYSGNYLNCLADQSSTDCHPDPNEPAQTASKMDVLKTAIWQLINETNAAVNIGLMRFDNNGNDDLNGSGEGGMVVHEIKAIGQNDQTFYDTLFVTSVDEPGGGQLQIMSPNGPSPIQETLYEAYLYYTGQPAKYGNNSRVAPGLTYASVDAALPEPKGKEPYIKPGSADCNKNYIIMISDGTSTQDNGSTTEIEQLIGAEKGTNYVCDKDVPGGNAAPGPNQGDCVDDLAGYLQRAHGIITYTVGFDISGSPYFQAAEKLLSDTALLGQGKFVTARTSNELKDELSGILADIIKQNTTFTSPTLTVNAFNRTRNLEDLFITVFQPQDRTRWVGNLKKYIVKPPKAAAPGEQVETEIIYDAKTPAEIAVDPTEGFFDVNARSFWTDGVNDGAEVQLGGAANELPAPDARNLYTNLTGNGNSGDISLAGLVGSPNPNALEVANDGVTNEAIGLAVDATAEQRDALINWARGADVDDEDQDKDVTEQRFEMGDPLHSKPASVVYGAGGNPKDAVIYFATNDGYLHAINPIDGSELWAFIPEDLLGRLAELRVNEPLDWEPPQVPTRTYGLDGSVRALKIDVDRNGTVDVADGDKVYLFFGMGRGGYNYYGMDVTSRTKPILMWTIGPGIGDMDKTLEGGGQSWSTPVPAKVRIGANEKLVLLFGGGYDPGQDGAPAYLPDSVGNRIFMVDAKTGNLLWSAGPDNADLVLPDMTNSIPADLRVIDLTGDGLADRIYAADMGGRVWRFDIFNGAESAADLVNGGVLASLGGAEQPGDTSANRRFYYAPDPALITYGGQTWINIGIGSGHRGHPMDTSIAERFYSLRDRYPYTRWGTAPYDDDWDPIVDDDSMLLDVTDSVNVDWTDLSALYGWKIRLAQIGGAEWAGEKVLAESRTFQNKLYFTTFAPSISPVECGARVGKNRLWVVDVKDASPVGFSEGLPDNPTTEDRFTELGQAGIAPEVVFLFPQPEEGRVNAPQCLVGVVNCGTGISNPPVRTYWRQRGAN